jgi:hypothetical protein
LRRAAIVVLLLSGQCAHAADTWVLMGRHGECVPVRSLERKVPDIGDIADPDAFIRHMRGKGLAVTSTAMPVQRGAAVEVRVPGKELALVFATRELCSEIRAR